jgi:hypothetical protein
MCIQRLRRTHLPTMLPMRASVADSAALRCAALRCAALRCSLSFIQNRQGNKRPCKPTQELCVAPATLKVCPRPDVATVAKAPRRCAVAQSKRFRSECLRRPVWPQRPNCGSVPRGAAGVHAV